MEEWDPKDRDSQTDALILHSLCKDVCYSKLSGSPTEQSLELEVTPPNNRSPPLFGLLGGAKLSSERATKS